MIATPTTSFWVRISVRTDRLRHQGNLVEPLFYGNMTMQIRQKYQWYFEYRAALLKVKHPRHLVEMRWGTEESQGKTREHLLEKRISAKRGQLTKAHNAADKILSDYEANYFMSQAMTINEYLPSWPKFMAKIELKKHELEVLINELNALKQLIN